ncbi:MAG: hypothetical protein OQL16_08820 [Gammaproteobacteria bacterium]|nr:hypothetical protein [Gammaproteobacteria bacterium]
MKDRETKKGPVIPDHRRFGVLGFGILRRPNSYIHVVVPLAAYADHGWSSAVKNRMFENGLSIHGHKKGRDRKTRHALGDQEKLLLT